MYKRIVLTFIMALMFVAFATTTVYGKSEVIKVNTDSGTVSINYDTTDYSDLKVVVKKDSQKYIYDLFSANEELPLQMGSGEYAVGIYQKVEGKKYKLLESETFDVYIEDDAVFLASVQNVNWESDSKAAILAQDLTRGIESDREKVEVIYNYVINNVDYDFEKAENVGSRYLPSVDETLIDGQGICYDYASLMAAMLRSIDMPTKLVHGRSNFTPVYHAWNEVLIDGEWIVVDTTIDSALKSQGTNVSFEKNPEDYMAEKVF